jgi:hypothetical protein
MDQEADEISSQALHQCELGLQDVNLKKLCDFSKPQFSHLKVDNHSYRVGYLGTDSIRNLPITVDGIQSNSCYGYNCHCHCFFN